MEQAGFQTRYELTSSRKVVATRVKKAQVCDYMKIMPEMLNINADTGLHNGIDRCVLYWRNNTGKMWYKVNEALIEALLLKQETPDADNTEVLWQVKALYPNADIVLPDHAPQPKKLPKPKMASFPEDAIVKPDDTPALEMYEAPIGPEPAPITYQYDAPIGPEPAPQAEKPKTYYREAVAMGFGWKTDTGKPNPKAALVGKMLSMFLGTAKVGKYKEFRLEEPMSDAEIVGFWLWYREKTKREGNLREFLPKTPETLNRRALEFRSDVSGKNRAAWIEKGRATLDRVMGVKQQPSTTEAQSGLYYAPDLQSWHAPPDWKKRSRELQARLKAEQEAADATLEDS
jgi:hypothetical protein